MTNGYLRLELALKSTSLGPQRVMSVDIAADAADSAARYTDLLQQYFGESYVAHLFELDGSELSGRISYDSDLEAAGAPGYPAEASARTRPKAA